MRGLVTLPMKCSRLLSKKTGIKCHVYSYGTNDELMNSLRGYG